MCSRFDFEQYRTVSSILFSIDFELDLSVIFQNFP